MSATLDERIEAVAAALPRMVENLRGLGYVFSYPAHVLPGPEAGTEAAIERLDREVGALPAVLKAFWRRIGSVNFTGKPPEAWDEVEYADQLIVYPPSAALDELDESLSDWEEWSKCGNEHVIMIAPDAYTKADVSGGMGYHLRSPSEGWGGDDPPLHDEPHNVTLLTYLELAVRWGGFPGLEEYEGHNWPLGEILRGVGR